MTGVKKNYKGVKLTVNNKYLLSVGGEVPEFEVFAGAKHQQTPQIQVFFTNA
jgi:hypothetical protein